MLMRRLLAPVLARSTYRGLVYLILGGAMLVPYLLFAALAVPVLGSMLSTTAALVAGGLVALAVMAASSFIPAVRVLEGTAVRELLDDPIPDVTFGPVTSWPVRLRSGAMFMLHVLAGGVLSFLALALPVLLVLGVIAPFTGRFSTGLDAPEVARGWAGAWLPAVLLLAVLALVYLVAAVGALLARAAAVLLGVSAAERIEQLERRTERLAERNRLARELHDSVGHALSVVTIQAGAARRTLRRDPEFTERALTAIEDSARAALDDLDHVLGLLRDEAAGTSPQAGLDELPALLGATRLAGVDVREEVRGELSVLPPMVSREAYRILQECLTNVFRHAGKVPVTLRLAVAGDELRLLVRNPVGGTPSRRERGGTGLRGMAERVDLLRGELRAGRDGEDWEVRVRLPWGAGE
ncbi:sensor histidine kinase [Amycolatopsis nigrescens]|uniref:sensor histidine kinase n=1 Tax=Amycolatopsis nigrescens TaxID=381445 RepID=UPI0003797379|nr:histidine kinase [Amycolatopsis nigrescens]